VKQLLVISGKGGTGKTSIVASIAHLAARTAPVVAADCDVDAANLALLLPGEDTRSTDFYAGIRADIDPERCTGCEQCVEHCRAGAIRMDDDGIARVDPLSCEGCGVCGIVCQVDAVSFRENLAGVWKERRIEEGTLVHAELGIAQDNSGKLVAEVRKQAREAAERDGVELVLVDGPPGIGCPVHASLTGCDLALVVTEPTPSGEHDLTRVLQLLDHFKVPASILINKSTLSPEYTGRIKDLAHKDNRILVGEIPFLTELPRALSRAELPIVIPQVHDLLSEAWQVLNGALESLDRKEQYRS
jgi:MinD superfamily P-loop ATPase